MKEIYRDLNLTTVRYYKSLLEDEGIPVILRNEYTTASGITSIPIPEFYPNISVLNDDDFQKAWEILNQAQIKANNSDVDIICPHCGEPNPGNFEICYLCNKPLPEQSA
ncbi:DUF2007 domain-containing protein [Geomonas sp. Red32]|uniref:putative signal transducing protein n=1 Tax=Geomonas sp. Red32 TaxID=2912856 RepID=UPI00202CD15A|nr:DUF2007 domain-containing protein [Geomonas sp. Red32]MCM0082122.1 DUF2007 domain-containing protein [Geomonas sp. Red32]